MQPSASPARVSAARDILNPTRNDQFSFAGQVAGRFLTITGMTGVENRGGQAVCCDTTRLAREALRPPVASLQSRGLSRPQRPTTRNPARFLRPCPTPRGLDGRQRRVPLHRQPGEPCSPDTPSVRHSRPTPRRKAFRLSAPDQPCAGWMRGNRIAWCNGIRDLAALMRPSPQPPPSFRAGYFSSRHLHTGRARLQRRSPL